MSKIRLANYFGKAKGLDNVPTALLQRRPSVSVCLRSSQDLMTEGFAESDCAGVAVVLAVPIRFTVAGRANVRSHHASRWQTCEIVAGPRQ